MNKKKLLVNEKAPGLYVSKIYLLENFFGYK